MTKKHPWLEKILPLIIILISILLYLNTLPNTFVYDDAYVITENYFIKSWGNLPKLFTKDYLPLSGELSYRPIVTLTYFFDYAIWRLNPLGYHLTNVILHTVNVFLFYVFIRKVFLEHGPSPFLPPYCSCPIPSYRNRQCCLLPGRYPCFNFLPAGIYLFYKDTHPFLRKRKLNTTNTYQARSLLHHLLWFLLSGALLKRRWQLHSPSSSFCLIFYTPVKANPRHHPSSPA